MAILPLFFRGQSVDFSGLTAVEDLVRKGKKFIGRGSPDIRTGTLAEKDETSYKLPINGTYNIPAGIHNAEDTVDQEIATMAGQIVTPGAGPVVIQCAGKYMTGDIIVYAVENLTAENIKFGEVVGEGEGAVTGTCQGFFD